MHVGFLGVNPLPFQAAQSLRIDGGCVEHSIFGERNFLFLDHAIERRFFSVKFGDFISELQLERLNSRLAVGCERASAELGVDFLNLVGNLSGLVPVKVIDPNFHQGSAACLFDFNAFG